MESRNPHHETRNTKYGPRLHFWLVAALLLFLSFRTIVRAQTPVEGTNFKVAGEFFDPPYERQMKSLIEGARWRHQGAQTEVYDVKVQRFRTNNTVELIIEAPECFYDEHRKSIDSAGPVQFRTADGRFFLSGVGFLWLQTNSILYISNQVKTVVLPEFIEAGSAIAPTNTAGQAAKGVTIFSDRFEYARDSGIGIYSGNVHAVGTNVDLKARSDVMEVLVPVAEHQLQTVTMNRKVVLDYESVEATGDKAVYTAATGLAKITGSPAWHDTNQTQGRGDELVIDRTNRIFRANGQAWVKMPAQSMGANALLSSATNSAPGTNQFVEIFSDYYEFRTNSVGNSAQFGDHVHMVDTSDGKTNGTLTAATMLVTLLGTNQLQSMVAEKNVVIENEDNRFTGQKAVYTATNSILELTGNPTWRAGDRDGKGEVILVDLSQNRMEVVTNAYMRLPSGELGPSTAMAQASGDSSPPRQPSMKSGDAGKSRVAPPTASREKVEGNFSPLPLLPEEQPKTKPPLKRDTPPSTPQFAEVFSERYVISTNAAASTARFEGGVRIVHPRLNWICRTMNVDSPNTTNKDVTMTAEQAVEFTFAENGQNVHGACNRAVYNYSITPSRTNGMLTLHTNDMMTLTGNPIVETTNGIITNKVIMLNCANNKLIAPGKYGIYGTNAPPIPTNAFQFSVPGKKK